MTFKFQQLSMTWVLEILKIFLGGISLVLSYSISDFSWITFEEKTYADFLFVFWFFFFEKVVEVISEEK